MIELRRQDYYGKYQPHLPFLMGIVRPLVDCGIAWNSLEIITDDDLAIGFSSESVDLSGTFKGRVEIGCKNHEYIIEWFCEFVKDQEPNKVKNILVPNQLPDHSWWKLSDLAKSNTTLENISFDFLENKVVSPIFLQNINFYLLFNKINNLDNKSSENYLGSLLNSINNYLDNKLSVLDLRNSYIGYLPHNLLEQLFVLIKNKAPHIIDLSHNHIGDQEIKIISKGLNECLSIEKLILSNNKITYLGISYFADELKISNIQKVDFSSNFISNGSQLLEDLKQKVKKNLNIRELNISQNFIREDFESKLNKYKVQPNSIYKYDFFYTQHRTCNSLIKSTEKISKKEWLIFLACKKGTQHAMIYVEGMRCSGQKFIKKIHITALNIMNSNAKPEIKLLEPRRLFNDADKYYLQWWKVSNVAATALFGYVQEDIDRGINFSIVASYGKVNCLEWAFDKLEQINIKVDRKMFPSSAAGGPGCIIS